MRHATIILMLALVSCSSSNPPLTKDSLLVQNTPHHDVYPMVSKPYAGKARIDDTIVKVREFNIPAIKSVRPV